MQVTETQDVACPKCGTHSSIPVPDRDVELKVSPYVAAFGEYTKVECSDEHVFWVYYC
ncbi:hypothetical protein [Natronorubrum thiooxidans]|uniref:Uncharacterized protein n=1 Tax=Natronorubrum thiooxidans TaxID=308853 RepID=A0A1N7FVJ7_9EURY|nr:hypothetical protein [Natronorubrum thiooxidans]SIS04393.1 hypothetical protein SAMN05421752_108150 [Natronorubrum thiooxidans]